MVLKSITRDATILMNAKKTRTYAKEGFIMKNHRYPKPNRLDQFHFRWLKKALSLQGIRRPILYIQPSKMKLVLNNLTGASTQLDLVK